MYLDTWMIVTSILAFGICAFVNSRQGFVLGATTALQVLERERMIKIDEDGNVKRWTAYNNLPVKKRTKKKKVDKSS